MPTLTPTNITFFSTPAEFRNWLHQHHLSAKELWVGYHKKETGVPSITWPESVDQALCYGWIDGIRKSIDAATYTIRFTPRNPKSVWSSINIKRVEELTKQGLMQPAGLKAFALKDKLKSEIYSFEQRIITLNPAYEEQFKTNPAAWSFFTKQAPSYQRTAIWWVMSAKQEETRLKRLGVLIADSEAGLRIASLRPASKNKS